MIYDPKEAIVQAYNDAAAIYRAQGNVTMAEIHERAARNMKRANAAGFNKFEADVGVTGPGGDKKYGLCQKCGKDVVMEKCTGYHCPFDGTMLSVDQEDGVSDCPSCGAPCKP
jgi:hypothetical protein